MIRAILSFFGFIFSWATSGLLMAALGIGAIFWMYGRDLPHHEQLVRYEPPTLSTIYSVEGKFMDEFARERRMFTPIDEIPDVIRNAFISAEDKNFYTHRGYDPLGILKAVIDAAQGGRLRGASTITQQVMKNFLLDGGRTAERKIKEIILASRLENTLVKDKILELYLNEIFLGQNSYGVTAAAQTYFNKPLEEITAQEAAYLAVLPKAPSTYHPVRQKERAIVRRNFVLKEMVENKYLTEEEGEIAKAADLKSVQAGDFTSYRLGRPKRDYFTDEIRRQLSDTFGEEEFFGGGMTIRATMDQHLQKVAALALREGLEGYDRKVGIYHGPLMTLSAEEMADEEVWRDKVALTALPRDIDGWQIAVVLDLDDKAAKISVEGEADIEGGHAIPIKDLKWVSTANEEGKRNKDIKKPSQLFAVGDVIHVMKIFGPIEDAEVAEGEEPPEEFKFWSFRQVPKIQDAFTAMDTNTGRVIAMQGGFSYQHSVFNRATQATRRFNSFVARLTLQA